MSNRQKTLLDRITADAQILYRLDKNSLKNKVIKILKNPSLEEENRIVLFNGILRGIDKTHQKENTAIAGLLTSLNKHFVLSTFTGLQHTTDLSAIYLETLMADPDPSNEKKMIDLFQQNPRLIHFKDREGQSPLLVAIRQKFPVLINFLIQKKVNINQADYYGWTPLFCAVYQENIELTKMLITNGADINAMTMQGSTAFFQASLQKHKDMSLYLQQQLNHFGQFWLDIKLLAHRFGLESQVTIKQRSFSVEGLSSPLAYMALCQSLETNFIKHDFKDRVSFWSPEDSQVILEAMKRGADYAFYKGSPAEIQDLMDAIHQEKITVLPTGWEEHATSIVIKGDVLIKCNRGERSEKGKAGMEVFKIKDRNQIRAVLPALLAEKDKSSDFFDEGIHKLVELEPIDYFAHKDQHASNCAWTSAKLSLRAAIYLHLLAMGQATENAAQASYKIYKYWTDKDRLYALDSFVRKTPPQDLESAMLTVLKSILNKCSDNRYPLANISTAMATLEARLV
ncbi:ankyrin repeat domain-containing protein [Candidatus Protochlamydia phocaeensis]|uniref:ankyrin repeat domain-containing protein n=1 Tax=Candidatus Protochlamydia phocaeensis TaxID=1414722 RepID=UPI0018967EDA|nr:ankyrin repeat domain-containing protein [Candidatus Protochlamydia phocaeensis]